MKKIAKSLIIRKLNKKLIKLLATHKIKIITVTGSIGKSSAKVAIGQLLATKFKINYSEDSYNTDIGLPLGIFGLKVPARLWSIKAWDEIFRRIDTICQDYPYEIVIVEVADDERVVMEPIVRRLRPQLGVLTGVAPVHMERMRDMDKVVEDAWELANLAEELIYNADFETLRAKAGDNKGLSYGIDEGSLRFSDIKRGKDGYLSAKLQLGNQNRKITTKHISKTGLYNLLAAASVGMECGLSFDDVADELVRIGPLVGRMNLLAGINGIHLIDDSYNSSPDAAVAALEAVAEFNGRKVAVLGSMNELGGYSVKAHAQVGEKAAKVVDLLVVIGREAERYMIPAALQGGLDKSQIKYFRTPYEAGHYLKGVVKAGDTVLVKGSQDGIYTEEVSRILLKEGLDPRVCLVRQSTSWQRKKKKSFAP